ncbi:hypothetical protein D5086_005701 [Populus alba]|uniref:Uncharacterized protein n=1 Tax=Populus alba TaxID=43335 RepID=A0ACC4CUR8_POPAL
MVSELCRENRSYDLGCGHGGILFFITAIRRCSYRKHVQHLHPEKVKADFSQADPHPGNLAFHLSVMALA